MDEKTIESLIASVIVVAIVVLIVCSCVAIRESSAAEGYAARLNSESMSTPPPVPESAPVSASTANEFDYYRFRVEGTYEPTGLPVVPDDLQKLLY